MNQADVCTRDSADEKISSWVGLLTDTTKIDNVRTSNTLKYLGEVDSVNLHVVKCKLLSTKANLSMKMSSSAQGFRIPVLMKQRACTATSLFFVSWKQLSPTSVLGTNTHV